jgi:hypothetical protein
VRALINHLHIAPLFVELARRQSQDVLTFKKHLTGGRFHQSENGTPQGGFSATRFANYSEGLLGVYIQINPVNCTNPA